METPQDIPENVRTVKMKNSVKPGDLVRYILKNELGVVKRCDDNGCFIFYHTGGTAAKTKYEDFEITDINRHNYSNEYAIGSLLERSVRIKYGGDYSDLIDDEGTRTSVRFKLSERNKHRELVRRKRNEII